MDWAEEKARELYDDPRGIVDSIINGFHEVAIRDLATALRDAAAPALDEAAQRVERVAASPSAASHGADAALAQLSKEIRALKEKPDG